jgi:hypothetical protein
LTSLPANHIIQPGVGIFTGSRFRPIRLGNGKGAYFVIDAGFTMAANQSHFADIKLETFDPELYRSCWTVRHNSDGAGITEEELQRFFLQCFHCENVVLRTSHAFHECPEVPADPTSHGAPGHATDKSAVFEKLEYRLDALGEGHLLHGLTTKEFEGYYSKCISCNRFLTDYGRDHHVCRESIMLQSLADSDDLDGSE